MGDTRKQLNQPHNQKISHELQLRQLTALLEISRRAVSLDTEPLLGLILDQLKTIVDYSRAAVIAIAGDELTILAFRGARNQQVVLPWQVPLKDAQIHRQVIQRQKPIIISDLWADTPEALAVREVVGQQLASDLDDVQSWMGIPLIVKEQMRGMLALFHNQSDFYTSEQVDRALAFAHQVAMAIENDRLYQQIHHLATLQERDRLAREMHDQLAQALGYINIQTSIISNLLETGQINEAHANLQELKQVARDTYTDVREEIFNLRTKLSAGEKFLPLLRDYLAEFQKHHAVEVNLIIEDKDLAEFSAAVGTQLIRIIQEALHNIRKHAQASQIVIRLEPDQDRICLCIEDNGRGFDPEQIKEEKQSSFGLQIMGERAESVGGSLEIGASPGQGTRLRILIPAPD